MRTITIQCNRCGQNILGGHSVLNITAGDLVSRHGDPIDVCGDCCERFGDWLRGPRQTAALTPGTATTLSTVESSALVGGA
jgi:hypothetical protein